MSNKNEIAGPPYSEELEQVVLGSILIDARCIHQVMEIIQIPEVFFKDHHRQIFMQCIEVYKNGKSPDLMLVSEGMKGKEAMFPVDPVLYLMKLMDKVVSTVNVQEHCMILLNYYIKRVVIQENQQLVRQAYLPDSDGMEILAGTQNALNELHQKVIRESARDLKAILKDTELEVEALAQRQPGEVTGVPTGFRELNEKTNGWQRGDLIILAARPSMGKTAFAVKEIMESAYRGKPVLLFEMEMKDTQIIKRMICQHDPYFHANMLFQHGLKTEEDWRHFHQAQDEISRMPIVPETTAALNLFELNVKARQWAQKHKQLGLIVIDYLQLMQGYPGKRYGNREQEIAEISRGLKRLAMDLDVPVIALSQLSREVERRGGDKRPKLADLRESGAIEQDADAVIFLYRPEYYDFTEMEDGTSSEGVAEVIVAKYRNGQTGTVLAGFNNNRVRFDELDVVRQQKGIKTFGEIVKSE